MSSNAAKMLGIKKYKLDEKTMADLEDIMSLVPGSNQKIKMLKEYLKTINNNMGRQYVIQSFLNNDPDFSKLTEDQMDANLYKYWKPVDNYTPPDIQRAINKQDAEDFWNWSSDKHWMKRSEGEMKRRADAMGYPDVEAFTDALKQEQALRDFRASLTPGEVAVNFLFPRTADAIESGKYNDKDLKSPWELLGDKNVLLDMGENFMYSLDPAGRVVRDVGAKAAEKLGEGIVKNSVIKGAKLAANAANPLIMEGLDAVTYDEEDDTDRSKFNLWDVGVGTSMNTLMGGLLSKGGKKVDVKDLEYAPKMTKENKIKKLESQWAQQDYDRKLNELLQEKQQYQTLLNDEWFRNLPANKKIDYIASLNKSIEDLGERPQLIIENTPISQMSKDAAKYTAKQLLPRNALNLFSNKVGDQFSEDPKKVKRAIVYTMGNPMLRSSVGDFVNAYYDTKNKNKEKEKIDKDMKELRKQMQLIYGLQDWRNE